MKLFRVLPLLLLPIVAMVGCDNTASSQSGAESGPAGGVAFRLSTSVILRYQTEVDSLEIRLDNGTEQRVLRVGLASTASVNDLASGVWKVEVSLTRDGFAKYQGSTAVVIKSGEIAQAQVVLKPAGGGVVIDIVVDSTGGAIGGNPAILQGTWTLWSMPVMGLATVTKVYDFSIESNGCGSGSDGQGNEHAIAWYFAANGQLVMAPMPSTKIGTTDSEMVLIAQGLSKFTRSRMTWSYDTFYTGGCFGSTSPRLSFRDSATGIVLATFTRPLLHPVMPDSLSYPIDSNVNIPPKLPIPIDSLLHPIDSIAMPPRIPFIWPDSTTKLLGTWYLKSLPIEGIEAITRDIPLTFDSTGKVNGSDGCNAMGGSWKIDASGRLSLGGITQTNMACLDSTTQIIEKGMHLLASGALTWSVDTGWSAAYRTLTLSSGYTGAVIATFTPYPNGVLINLAPLHITDHPGAIDTLLIDNFGAPVSQKQNAAGSSNN